MIAFASLKFRSVCIWRCLDCFLQSVPIQNTEEVLKTEKSVGRKRLLSYYVYFSVSAVNYMDSGII